MSVFSKGTPAGHITYPLERQESRTDSVLDISEEKKDSQASRRPAAKNGADTLWTTLRSAPIDHRFSYDMSKEIQKAWSMVVACSPNDPLNDMPTLPATVTGLKRKSLAEFLAQPNQLVTGRHGTEQTLHPQPESPLFNKLPPEIREQIWGHLLTHDGVILCVADGGLPRSEYNLHPSILATCRRILHEALPILYSRNHFSVFHIPNLMRSRTTPPRFTISPRYFPLLRHLNIDIPDKFMDRWYATRWGEAYESYAELTAALVHLAGPNLRHLQLKLVRNCALESYTSWGPYVANDSLLMKAVAARFLPRPHGARRRFLLLAPCAAFEPDCCFDVLRPDAPMIVHAVARNLGTLQRTARLNGLPLEEALVVRVWGREGRVECSRDARTEIAVRRDGDGEGDEGGEPRIVLEVAC